MRGKNAALTRIREICLSFSDTSERPSHGAPTFFVREKKSFVSFMDDHHGDGRLALWCAAPPGAQRMLVESRPEHFFVPAYVGYRGWIGVRLDRDLSYEEIARVIADAYAAVAPKELAAASRNATTATPRGRSRRAGPDPRARGSMTRARSGRPRSGT